MSDTIKRVYGKEISVGDIMYNKESDSVFCKMKFGFFGFITINLVKNETGTYDLFKSIYKDGKADLVRIGKTFEVKKADGSIVEGLTQTTLGLGNVWDTENKKDITSNNNALFITTHKLRESAVVNDNISKVGWITGQFGIEVDGEKEIDGDVTKEVSVDKTPTKEPKSKDDIPF